MPVSKRVLAPFALPPGEGLSVENPAGGVITFKLRGDESDGQVTAADTVVAPGLGPPLHRHPDQDETLYTLEGNFRVRLGDELLEAPPGSFVYIPRGTQHTWLNVGESVGRFVFTLTPAAPAFELFFVRYAELPPERRGVEAFTRLAHEMGAMEVVGPPLGTSPE
jgi:quercetin dioxygenase-like cupin family protein